MQADSQVLNIPIEDIIPNRFQPRLSFDDDSLKELAESIKEHGIIQPLILRRLGDKYEIVAGERRYKAAKIAGLDSVPAIITTMDDKKSAEVSIVENVQRKDLTAIEEARSYKALLDKGYLTQDELARKMGLSQSAISNKLRLLSLSTNVQEALLKGQISERHARSLLQISSLDEQDEWLKKIIDERLTVRELGKRIRKQLSDNKDDDVPLIEDLPPVEVIKDKAKDLFYKKEASDNIKQVNESNNVPNKFFNFLEDESVNMSSNENQSLLSVQNEENDIEMLDIDVTKEYNNDVFTESDINVITQEMNSAIDRLRNQFNVNFEFNNEKESVKIVIKIDKNKS